MTFSRFRQKLNEPFPSRTSTADEVRSALWISLFVALFLYLVRPGGINVPGYSFFIVCLGFGLVTFVICVGFDLLCEYVLKIPTDSHTWTLSKWIVQHVVLITGIAIGNLVFVNFLLNWQYWSLTSFITMLAYTWIIGIFPVVFSGFNIQWKATLKNFKAAEELAPGLFERNRNADGAAQLADPQQVAEEIDSKAEDSLLINLAGSENRTISRKSVRYAEAMQNYVGLYFIEHGKLERLIIRDTIANIFEMFGDLHFVRCHRSFLVNLQAVTSVEGNAQGLKLNLDGVEDGSIPVSRTFVPAVRHGLAGQA